MCMLSYNELFLTFAKVRKVEYYKLVISCTRTYQLVRMWQHSLVPAVGQMPHQPGHGWWSFCDSDLALAPVVHVPFQAPCQLPLVPGLPVQHQDLVLVHYPGEEFSTV